MGNLEAEKLGKRIALAGGASLVILAMGFGIDQGSKPVRAADGTPTPTATSTPDAGDIKIANAYKTSTALAKDKTEAEIKATQTVISGEINALRGTPTVTSTPTSTGTATSTSTPNHSAELTATAEAIRLEALGKRQAEIKATATAQALPTATVAPSPRPVPTYIAPPESVGSGGGLVIPWDRVLEATGILGGLGALYGFRTRIPLVRRIGNRIPGPHF